MSKTLNKNFKDRISEEKKHRYESISYIMRPKYILKEIDIDYVSSLNAKKFISSRKNSGVRKMVNNYEEYTCDIKSISFFMEKEWLDYYKNEYTYYKNMSLHRVVQMNGVKYLTEIAKKHDSVSLDSSVIGGMPAIKETRIPASLILACLKDGMTIQDISDDYNLPIDKVKGALEYVIDLLDRPFIEED